MDIEVVQNIFNIWAGSYDKSIYNSQWGFEGYDKILNRVVAKSCVQGGSTVLDLGTGTGNLSVLLERQEANVVGIDISEKMLGIARNKLNRAKLLHSDFRSGGFPTESFDAVVSAYALHHVSDQDKVRLVESLSHCIRPRGRFVFADYAFRSSTARQRIIDELMSARMFEQVREIESEDYCDLSFVLSKLPTSMKTVSIERCTKFVWLVTFERR